jgi:2-phosphosulfolactate phosphatase
MSRTVVIAFLPASASRYVDTHAIVAVDVIRATTTVVSAVAAGWRCFPVARLQDAIELNGRLKDALLVGELGGNMPDGFHMNNSPAKLAQRTDKHRPLIVLSTSGTDLLVRARPAVAVYPACFRNYAAVAKHVAATHERVAVIGAGSRNEFREEDQMCCAWIAKQLLEAGFSAENGETLNITNRWHTAAADACLASHSADYLIRSNQMDDLEFVLSHINDLDAVYELVDQEVLPVEMETLADLAA